MKSTKTWLASLVGLSLALTSVTARATVVSFNVDATGTNQVNAGGAIVGAGIAPTAANSGKYAAGSYLALSGGVGGNLSGTAFSGSFAAQKASSGAFSTGNPGSLLGFYGGSLLADINYYNNTIKITGGSLIDANVYTGTYPIKGGPAVGLSPAVGGGIIGTPGTAPADYGVNLKITALFGLVTVANGTAALRDVIVDLEQRSILNPPPVAQEALVGGTLASKTFASQNNLEIGIVQGNMDFNLKGSVVLGNTVPDLVGTTPIGSDTYTVTTAGPATLNTFLIPNGKQIGEAGALANIMITIPIKANVVTSITGDVPITATITLTGSIAAYQLNVEVPEPGTIALASIAGLALIPVGVRRYRARKARTSK